MGGIVVLAALAWATTLKTQTAPGPAATSTGATTTAVLGLGAETSLATTSDEEADEELPPVATTQAAIVVANSAATLRATIDPNGSPTTYWFEYSSDPQLGAILVRTTPHISLVGDTVKVSVEVDVSGLTGSTTYYYRIIAQNNGGIVRGERNSLKTK